MIFVFFLNKAQIIMMNQQYTRILTTWGY